MDAHDITVTALADAAEVTRPRLSAWLNGHRDTITLASANKIFDGMKKLSSASTAKSYACKK